MRYELPAKHHAKKGALRKPIRRELAKTVFLPRDLFPEQSIK